MAPPQDIPITEDYSVGPAARIFEATPDVLGSFAYHLEGHQPRRVALGQSMAHVELGVLSVPGVLMMFRLDALDSIAAITVFLRDSMLSLVFVGQDVFAYDAHGNGHAVTDVLPALPALGGRILMDAVHNTFGIGYLMNPNNRDFYHDDILGLSKDASSYLNRLEIWFDAIGGDFQEAKLTIQEKDSQKLVWQGRSSDFPLIFPSRPKSRRRLTRATPQPPPKPVDLPPRPETWSGGAIPKPPSSQPSGTAWKIVSNPRDSDWSLPSSGAARKVYASPATPSTTGLNLASLLETLQKAGNDAQRWKIIDDNLALNKPERTFALIGRFGSLIAEKTAAWPAQKLVETLGDQPAAALDALLPSYKNDVILALLEDHAERDRLMASWRDSELERLLRMSLLHKLKSSSDAVAWLRVSATADKSAIKKVWRTLLGFLNVDFGRREETALHQKKDEIAKRLQAARELLIRGGT